MNIDYSIFYLQRFPGQADDAFDVLFLWVGGWIKYDYIAPLRLVKFIKYFVDDYLLPVMQSIVHTWTIYDNLRSYGSLPEDDYCRYGNYGYSITEKSSQVPGNSLPALIPYYTVLVPVFLGLSNSTCLRNLQFPFP